MKTVVITGATSGIGFAVAKGLADRDTHVIGVGRDKEKGDAAIANIKKQVPEARIRFFYGDLSRQSDVNQIADDIKTYLESHCDGILDVLINNAGGVRNWYTTTPEGYELQFALNHLAGFLLTYRLMDNLKKGDGRMILTGSDSHKYKKMNWKDIMYKKRYSCLMAYKQSKLCNMLYAREFNRRFRDAGLSAYVVDPGLVNTDIGSKQTSGMISWFWSLRKKGGVAPAVAAQTYEYLCKKTPTPDGLYYYQCRERKYSRHVDDDAQAKRLFELSEKLCGISYG